jgi:hypothetical protein
LSVNQCHTPFFGREENPLVLGLLGGRIIFWACAKLLQRDALPQPAFLHHKSTGAGVMLFS